MTAGKYRFIPLLLFLTFILCFSSSFAKKKPARSISDADDCTLTFKGKERKSVKLRSADDGNDYEIVNNNNPITVAAWLKLVCKLDKYVPAQVPQSTAMLDIETKKVIIEGYLLAAKFKADEDQDIHAEISDSPQWASDHIIIEVPPGEEYCKPRKALWDLVKGDEAPLIDNEKILVKPVKIRATGFIFLDAKSSFSDRCTTSGGRGLKIGKHAKSKVVGLYELHPVIELSSAGN